jgi:hypothetical protein
MSKKKVKIEQVGDCDGNGDGDGDGDGDGNRDGDNDLDSDISVNLNKLEINIIINIFNVCLQKNLYTMDDFKKVGTIYEKLKIYK